MSFASSPLKRINHLIAELEQTYHRYALSSGLSDSEFSILYTLSTEGSPCQLSQVVKLSGLPKQTVNSALRKMVADGIITLEEDGRRKSVSLTDKGVEKCRESVLDLIEIENGIFSLWGKEKSEEYISWTEEYQREMRKGLSDDSAK